MIRWKQLHHILFNYLKNNLPVLFGNWNVITIFNQWNTADISKHFSCYLQEEKYCSCKHYNKNNRPRKITNLI